MIISGSTGPPLDLLVIHLDADVAFENDLQEGECDPVLNVQQPCPPASATADQIQQVITRWLRYNSLPPQVILAIPAQDTESWTFAALFSDDEICGRDDYECLRSRPDHPGYRLTLKRYGKLFQRRGSEIKKHKRDYEKITPHIAEGWDTVRRTCTQAERFTQDVLDRLGCFPR